jgi:RNA polymerase sigma factor (sigma-70 family)
VQGANPEIHWTVLMEQSLEGDTSAYRRLLELLTPALRRTVRARAGAAGLEAEDVVQEVLLALHIKRETWAIGTPVAPWVTAIARNKLIDAHRRRARRVEVSIDSVSDSLWIDATADQSEAQDIESLLAQLSERQREVLHAVSLQGYSAQETAQRLNMTEVSVRVTLHRTLKRLADISQG